MRTQLQRLSLIIPGVAVGIVLSASALAAQTGVNGSNAPGSFKLAQLDRVCCTVGHRTILTDRLTCQRQRGRVVRDSACRRDQDDRQPVCCARRGQNWITTERQCRRAGGQEISARHCRVCCQKDGRYRLRTYQACRLRRGRVVDLDHCRRAEERRCCYKQTRDGKHHFRRLQPKPCKDWGGRLVADKYCRR